MRAASEEMRSAAGDLRRQDPARASERGARALERLRDIERQLQASAPDEQRRARGDLQLEARELAARQRQVESELGRADRDATGRLAVEQDRLADRARTLQQGLSRQAAANGATDASLRQALAEASREFASERVAEHMQQAADQMRTAAGQAPQAAPSDEAASRKAAAALERDAARALDRLADRLASDDLPLDEDSRTLASQLERARELQQRLDELSRELGQLDQQARESAGGSPSRGRSGQPSPGTPAGDTGTRVERLRDEYSRTLREARELLDQVRRDDNTVAQGGQGFTFEGQGMVLSAPGTEAFKQDFDRWEALRKQATQALERAESSLSRNLQARASRDRLAAGVDGKPPASYQEQVDRYFKALATKKKP